MSDDQTLPPTHRPGDDGADDAGSSSDAGGFTSPSGPPTEPMRPSYSGYQPSSAGGESPSEPVSPSGPSAPEPAAATPPPYGQSQYGQPQYGQPSAAQPPYGQAPYGQAPYGQAPYGQPPIGQVPYGAFGYAQSHSGATTSMVLGIVSLVCLVLACFSCGITYPGFLTGPFAIAIGLKSKREIEANPQAYNNAGQAQAGYITGLIGTIIGVLCLAAVVALFAVGVSMDPNYYD